VRLSNRFRISHLSPDQVGFNNQSTNTISDLAKISITWSSTPELSKDAANFVAKQKQLSQCWLQDHFHQNIPIQVHLLKTRSTQGHHLNLRNSLVLFPSTLFIKFSKPGATSQPMTTSRRTQKLSNSWLNWTMSLSQLFNHDNNARLTAMITDTRKQINRDFNPSQLPKQLDNVQKPFFC
jgi:hypothetical protein